MGTGRSTRAIVERWLAVIGMVLLFAVAAGADQLSSSEPTAVAVEAEPQPLADVEEDPEPQEDRDQEDDVLDGRASAPQTTSTHVAPLAGADPAVLPCGVGDDLFRPPISTRA